MIRDQDFKNMGVVHMQTSAMMGYRIFYSAPIANSKWISQHHVHPQSSTNPTRSCQ